MATLPRRTLRDWTPDLGLSVADWLAELSDEGWVPEYGHGGVEVAVNGRSVLRFAMIGSDDLDPAHWPEPGVDATPGRSGNGWSQAGL